MLFLCYIYSENPCLIARGQSRAWGWFLPLSLCPEHLVSVGRWNSIECGLCHVLGPFRPMGCHEIWVQSPRIGTVILNSLLIPAALGKSRATLGLVWKHYWGYLPEHGWLKNSCITGNPTPSWAMARKSRPGAPCTACRQLLWRALPKPLLVSPLPCRMDERTRWLSLPPSPTWAASWSHLLMWAPLEGRAILFIENLTHSDSPRSHDQHLQHSMMALLLSSLQGPCFLGSGV